VTRPLIWIASAVAALVAAVVLYTYFAGGAPATLVGNPAASFDVRTTTGAPSSLAAYRGSVVVMNLWASWCPPCRAEMPDLERAYLARRARGLVVLGIDQGESPTIAAAFARSLRITYPILVDEHQQYGRVYRALGLPTTVIVDRRGTVVKTFDGTVTYDQVLAAVDPLVGKK
jgi:peroxiredoxin